MKKKFPIGTIVKLKNNNKLIMIIGYTFSLKLKKLFYYDYVGCFYPKGVVGLENTLLFKQKDIDKVFFMGYNSKKMKILNAINDVLDRRNENE